MKEQQKYYSNRILFLTDQFKKQKQVYRNFSLLRLFVFILICLIFFKFWGMIFLMPITIILFGLFLWLVGKSIDAKLQRDKLNFLILFNQNELSVLDGDWSNYENGMEFIDGAHPYSYDIDLFGPKSIFQLLNRTSSLAGKKALSKLLKFGTKNPKVNEACIQVLSENIEWCQNFTIESQVRNESLVNEVSLDDLSGVEIDWSKLKATLRWVIPFTAFLNVALYAFSIINGFVFTIFLVTPLVFIINDLKTSNGLAKELALVSERIDALLAQLQLLKEIKSGDKLFNQKIEEILNDQTNVLEALKSLKRINKRFEFRMNVLVGVILNYFLAWDFQLQLKLKIWLNENRAYLASWENNMGEIECWISGAVFKFNNPELVFNKFDGSKNEIEIVGLGHPFVPVSKRVVNDFKLLQSDSFVVTTGPNMAGKSTYLRGIGLSIVLANAGFPIVAKKVNIPPVKLYSSMRTSDDLNIESSYFFAELKRLRFIMDAIESGEQVFIILDEILKGTNSQDKATGSAKFLEKLEKMGAKGIIATHDLSLCDLAIHSNSFQNWYFDSVISGSEISFDYKINKGVCKNMNASFLLKKMDLVD